MTTSDLKILDCVGHHSSSSVYWTKDTVDKQILKPRTYQQATELGKAMPRGFKKVNTRPHQESASPPKQKKGEWESQNPWPQMQTNVPG